jgi:hypothetical protein
MYRLKLLIRELRVADISTDQKVEKRLLKALKSFFGRQSCSSDLNGEVDLTSVILLVDLDQSSFRNTLRALLI